MFFKNFKSVVLDLKTYLVIKFVYPNRYPDNRIESFIFPETKIAEKIILSKNCLISPALKTIGKGTYIGNNTKIFECEKIGNFCSIGHNTHIGLSNHAFDHISTSPMFYDKSRGLCEKTTFNDKQNNRTTIENDVLISSSVLILSGVKIGTGAIVGAGSFVNKDVPPYAIVAGSPAKIIKYRFDDETIEKLLKSRWWDCSFEELKRKQNYFSNPNKFLNAE